MTESQQNAGLVGELHWSDWAQRRASVAVPQRTSILSKPLTAQIIQTHKPDCEILDIGAGNDLLKTALNALGFRGRYDTLDIDPQVGATYRSINEVDRKYDAIAMLEVIEHLRIEITLDYLEQMHSILNPGGLMIISTPDPSHPTWFWEDISHVQHYPYRDFVAILGIKGYRDVRVYRIVAFPKLEKYPVLVRDVVSRTGMVFRNLLSRLSGVNFESTTLVFVAQRKSPKP